MLRVLRLSSTNLTRCFSTSSSNFPTGPSWSVSSFIEPSEDTISMNDIQQSAALSNLSGEVPQETIHSVQRIINCAKTISEVDVSTDQFNLTDIEKELGIVSGMISPCAKPLVCRPDEDDNQYAKPLTLDSMKKNSTHHQMKGNFYSVPTVTAEEEE